MIDPLILAAIGAAVVAALCWVATELMEDYRERQHAAAWAAMHRRLEDDYRARIEARKALVDWAIGYSYLDPHLTGSLQGLHPRAQDKLLCRVLPLIQHDRRLSDTERERLIAAWKRRYGGGA